MRAARLPRRRVEPAAAHDAHRAVGRTLGVLDDRQFVDFSSLFTAEEGRRGAVVTLLAILELLREQILELSQTRPFGPIRVRAMA